MNAIFADSYLPPYLAFDRAAETMEIGKPAADRGDFFDEGERRERERPEESATTEVVAAESLIAKIAGRGWLIGCDGGETKRTRCLVAGETRASQGLKDLDGWCAAVIDSCD